LKKYPDMSNFALKAYYEYKEGLDLKLMYQDMYLASEGYIYQMQNLGDVDVDKMVSDYRRIIDFWKQLYKR